MPPVWKSRRSWGLSEEPGDTRDLSPSWGEQNHMLPAKPLSSSFIMFSHSQVRVRTIPSCTHQSSWPRVGAVVAQRCSPGLGNNLWETRGFCSRELKSHQLKRKTAFGERQEIAAAKVVKSLDKIFNTEKKRMLANC